MLLLLLHEQPLQEVLMGRRGGALSSEARYAQQVAEGMGMTTPTCLLDEAAEAERMRLRSTWRSAEHQLSAGKHG